MPIIYRRKHRELKTEINIIPLLDVLLVILLVFVATVPISTQSVKVNLPDQNKFRANHIDNNSSLIIEVSGVDQYSIITSQERIDKLSSEKIITEIKRYIQLNPKTIFLIAGEKIIPYSEIIKTLNLLQNIGIKSVNLITQPVD